MKCQSCGKKDATFKYTEDINGSKCEIYFCLDCVKKFNYLDESNLFKPLFTNDISYDNIICSYCKNCGYRFEDYIRTSLFGCNLCYDTFCDNIDEILLKIQGKNRHIHILDKEYSKKHILERKKELLQSLIDEERYEEAATIRDEIKNVDKGED